MWWGGSSVSLVLIDVGGVGFMYVRYEGRYIGGWCGMWHLKTTSGCQKWSEKWGIPTGWNGRG